MPVFKSYQYPAMRPIYALLLALIMGTTATAEINSGGGLSVIGTRSNYSSIGGYLATQATSIGDNQSRNGFVEVIYTPAILEKTRDTDNDGMPDAWERRYGLSKTQNDRTSDHDGDGVPAWMEYIAGTSPNDETSRLDVTVDMVDGKPHVSLDTVSGRSYEFLVTQDFQNYVVWHTQSGTGNNEEFVFDMDSPEVEAEFGANPGKTFFFQVRIQLSD